jgi:hypothetical protein
MERNGLASKNSHSKERMCSRICQSKNGKPQLQKAILYSSLVNRHDAKDSYFEINDAVELLNRLIKQLKADKT